MTVFDEMVAELGPQTSIDKTNAQHEVMQQIALSGLQRGGFFEHAAFYGGTCLRIFHGLRRFSEDMDFTLTEKNLNVHLEDYFPDIIEAFKLTGREVEIKKKEKKSFGKVESAFLKDNTDVYDISFRTEKSLKVKIELDTDPPLDFETEQKLLLQPFSFMVLHALVYRNWQNRVKGRDWYDFEWYVANKVPLDFAHLQKRIQEFNGMELTKEEFISALKEHLASTDIDQVKQDVIRFLRTDPHSLDIWSKDYFLQLADMIVYKE